MPSKQTPGTSHSGLLTEAAEAQCGTRTLDKRGHFKAHRCWWPNLINKNTINRTPIPFQSLFIYTFLTWMNQPTSSFQPLYKIVWVHSYINWHDHFTQNLDCLQSRYSAKCFWLSEPIPSVTAKQYDISVTVLSGTFMTGHKPLSLAIKHYDRVHPVSVSLLAIRSLSISWQNDSTYHNTTPNCLSLYIYNNE